MPRQACDVRSSRTYKAKVGVRDPQRPPANLPPRLRQSRGVNRIKTCAPARSASGVDSAPLLPPVRHRESAAVDPNEWTFAWLSIAFALVVVLLARLRRRVLVLIVSSLVGAVVGAVALATTSMQRICDFERPVKVDTCSGIVIAVHGEHRLPQFMQGHSAEAWLIATGAFIGVLVADVVALGAMWAWSRLRRTRGMPAPPRGLTTA